MAPNLKVNLLALHEELHSANDGALPMPLETPQHDGGVIDSVSYWDWPADVPKDMNPVDKETSSAIVQSDSKGDASRDKSSDAGTLDETVNSDHYWAERNCDEDIDSKFFIDYSREMGRGAQKGTVVRKAIERKTGQRFAVKSCSRRKCKEEHVKHEAAMLLSCDHANIMKCYGTYQDSKNIHIVTEYASGGELYERVIERAKKRGPNRSPFSEPEAAHILLQVISALAHCHANGIVHRDVKLENVMLSEKKGKKNNLQIKLIDFGLAVRLSASHPVLTERVGTNFYVAPEVLNGTGYNQSCDLWAVGVIAYSLLTAKPPFRGVTEEETYDLIQSQEVQFTDEVWHQVSSEAIDFIKACLQKDPQQRPSAKDLLQNEWIQQKSSQVETQSKGGNKRLLQKFKKALHLS